MKCGVSYEEVYEAYWLCLRHKGNTIDAIRFEINAEEECLKLWQELQNCTYKPSRSIVFVSDKPVKREIFGAAFRDRVVDTVFAQRVTPFLEQRFIDDNYSTRVGKGTLYGIQRVEQMVREQSANYTVDCWVMKARYAVVLHVAAHGSHGASSPVCYGRYTVVPTWSG